MDIVCHRCEKAISRDNAAIRCDGTCGKLIHSNCIQAEDFHFLNIYGVKEFYCVNCMVNVELNSPKQSDDDSSSKANPNPDSKESKRSSSSFSTVVEEESSDESDIAQFIELFDYLKSRVRRLQYTLDKFATIMIQFTKMNTTMLRKIYNRFNKLEIQYNEMENCIINIERIQLHIKQEVRNLRIEIKEMTCKFTALKAELKTDLKTDFSFPDKQE